MDEPAPNPRVMDLCSHSSGTPAAFELVTVGWRAMRYRRGDEVLAAASTFGGRWRVTDPAGSPLLSLAPAGAPGTDDRDVVPHGHQPAATIMRDRRVIDTWLVIDRYGSEILRAGRNGPYEMALTGVDDILVGRVFATATAVVVEFGTAPAAAHCLALALPLYFATTGALQVESLDDPATDLALWR